MDSGSVTPSAEEKIDIGEVFDSQCSIYMSMGMTYNEFWYGDPRLVLYYRDAYMISRDRANYDLWLGGYYQYVAVATALGNAFKKKGDKAEPYLTEPIPIRQKSQTELDAEQEQKSKEIIAKLNRLQKMWSSSHNEDKNGQN